MHSIVMKCSKLWHHDPKKVIDAAFLAAMCTACAGCRSNAALNCTLAERALNWHEARFGGGVSDAMFGAVYRKCHALAIASGAEVQIGKIIDGEPEETMDTLVAMITTPQTFVSDSLVTVHRWASVILPWFHRKHRQRNHARLLDTAIALSASGLPPYCLLWITDWAYPGPLTHRERIALLEAARNTIWRLRGMGELS